MMKIFSVTALALSAALSFGVAQATTLNITGVTGVWTAADETPNTTRLSALGSPTISWGTPVGSRLQSSYTFAGFAPTGPFLQDEVFDLGTLTHQNRPIATGTSILGATLTVMVNLLIGGTPATLTSQFDFNHFETPNLPKTCADGGRNGEGVNIAGCADRVTAMTNLGMSKSYVIDGTEYFLEVTGFLNNGSPMTEFWTIEGQANTAVLQARFTTKPVDVPAPIPLPATGWLMIAGMGGLAAFRARRRRVRTH